MWNGYHKWNTNRIQVLCQVTAQEPLFHHMLALITLWKDWPITSIFDFKIGSYSEVLQVASNLSSSCFSLPSSGILGNCQCAQHASFWFGFMPLNNVLCKQTVLPVKYFMYSLSLWKYSFYKIRLSHGTCNRIFAFPASVSITHIWKSQIQATPSDRKLKINISGPEVMD